MKKILSILILASVTSLAFSQERISLSRSIDDNGRNLSIRVNGVVNGKLVDYARTFRVDGLSKSERNALADRVLDSLGVGKIESPTAPLPPTAPAAPDFEPAPSYVMASGSHHYRPEITLTESGKQSYLVGGDQPYTKEVRFDNESGLLHLRYKFTRSREEFIYEKTANAGDKSESERQEIIRNFEKEIELPNTM